MKYSIPWTSTTTLLTVCTLGLALAGTAGAETGDTHYDARLHLEKARVEVSPDRAQLEAKAELSARVPDLAVDFDPTTGALRSLHSHTDLLSATGSDGDARSIALAYLHSQRALLGLSEDDLRSMRLTDRVESKISGATHLHFRQTHRGLDVYGTALRVSVNRDGRILSVGNSFVPNFAKVAADLSNTPSLGAATAVGAAARFLGLPVSRTPSKATIFGDGLSGDGLSDDRVSDDGVSGGGVSGGGVSLRQPELSRRNIDAELQWLPLGHDGARLVWRFVLDRAHLAQGEEMTVDARTGKVWTRFDRVLDAQYRVYGPPVENPHFTTPLPPADARSLLMDPHDVATSPLGWHDDGTTSFTTLQGNNAVVTNEVVDCGVALDCDMPLDLSAAPAAYRDAGAVNAFFWANFFHDVTYVYGFDEAGGNFQVSNFGNGGTGGDPVDIRIQVLEACNATFSDTVDGISGVLNLYYCNGRDAALDNGVVLHELGHGINRRQVGGPSTSCLSNLQRPDEGWSDFFSLAFTAETGDAGTDARGIGSWILGGGPGGHIRSQYFSTDPAVNTLTYADLNGASVPYGVGEVWTQSLWEVFWALVNVHGFDADLSDLASGAGNQRALFYVVEGQRLTSCSPTLLNARDGVLQAATDNYGGADLCTVWQAFADFGMGINATNGGPSSTQGTADFNVPAACGGNPGNAPPQVTLLQPADGSSYTVGDTVTLSGSASDPEDGNLTLGLSWSSSLDGSLGTGGSFSTSGLSEGTHVITASVVDSGGASASESVTITVHGACLPVGAACVDRSDCCSNRCRGKGGSRTCRS